MLINYLCNILKWTHQTLPLNTGCKLQEVKNSQGRTGAPQSDKSTKENYINNLLTLVIWKCVYDRKVYLNIVKKAINIFSKKGFLRGAQCCQGGHKFCPPTQMLSYAPVSIDWQGYSSDPLSDKQTVKYSPFFTWNVFCYNNVC